MKDSDWWIESRDGKVGAAPNFQSHSAFCCLAASSLFYLLLFLDYFARNIMAGNEFVLGYTPDGICEIIMRPVRGPVTAYRVRTPPPPPPPSSPPCRSRSPSPPSRPFSYGSGIFCIPTSDGNVIEGAISPVFTNLKITLDTVSDRRSVREEERVRVVPPPRPPPPRTTPSARVPPPRPPPPRTTPSARVPPQRWISPPPPAEIKNDSEYRGIEVREVTSPSSAYGEVTLRKDEDIVEMITRTSQGLYPVVSTPPAVTQPEPSAPPLEPVRRGLIRPHSISPFTRNTKQCLDQDEDLESVVTFLDFIMKKKNNKEMVKTFSTEKESTPPPAPRPEVPPPNITDRLLNGEVVRPVAVRAVAARRRVPPSAALGAPPRESEEEEEIELPDLPSPAKSGIVVRSTVSSPCMYAGYSSDEEWESMDEMDEEYEYLDPYEDQGPWSSTPPPPCDTPEHEVCVPPAWGERIPGAPVRCYCILCHKEEQHHAVKCIQCGNAPGCCKCLWTYMRSHYNSGCPLCRAGDPGDKNPLAPSQPRVTAIHRGDVAAAANTRTLRRRTTAASGTLLCGIGRARGRGRPQPQEGTMTALRRGRGRGRRGRRGVTIEEERPLR